MTATVHRLARSALLILALIAALPFLGATANAQDISAPLAKLTTDSYADTVEAIGELAASGHPRAAVIVQAIQAGQPLEIASSDETLHNVHAVAKANAPFNLGMPAPGTKHTRTFTKPEIVPFKCDVHPWMRAWVAVVPHPFFAVTGADGRFAIRGLPAGTYTVEAWHERLPALTFTVTVGEGETKEHDVLFTAPPADPAA